MTEENQVMPENTGEESSRVTPEATEQTSEQGAQTNDDYNPDWYKSDGRVGKMWKSPDVRDDIVESYYNLERQYYPLKEQFKSYNSTFKELEIADMNALRELHAEYQELKNPENRTNQLAGYLSNWLDNPVYTNDVQRFFDDLSAREMQRLYPNMTAEQIQKQMDMEQKLKAFEARQQQQEREEYSNNYKKQLDVATDKNRKLAESLGFNYTPEVHNACTDYVIKFDEKHGYPCTLIEAFNELYGEKLEAARAARIESDILKRMEAKPRVPVAGNRGGGVAPTDLESSRKGVLDKIRSVF